MSCIMMDEIKSQVSEVLRYSQGIPNLNADKLVDEWFEAKQSIIDAWRGKTIIETSQTIIFELSPEEKRKRFNEFLNFIEFTYGNDALVEFLEINHKDFFTNHLSNEYTYNDITIPKGTKIIRAFKFFESDISALDDIQSHASMIIQEDKVSGQLCLSVHPLDYLSSSENTYHWRSCHALDGDYRSGNLSYMLDKSTIVCYLKGASSIKLPNFPETIPWNSKKWRMLVHVSEGWDAVFAGRQYPFASTASLDLVQCMLVSHLGMTLGEWTPWHDDYIKDFPGSHESLDFQYLAMKGRIYSLEELTDSTEHRLHFNDLLHSSFYLTPKYCWQRRRYGRPIKFDIGHPVKCLCCNKTNIASSDMFICESCEEDLYPDTSERKYCDCCGARIYAEDEWYFVDSGAYGLYCERCYEEELEQCPRCEKTYYTSEMIYDYELGEKVCPSCKEEHE